jgi:S1-C subfamily serine protease
MPECNFTGRGMSLLVEDSPQKRFKSKCNLNSEDMKNFFIFLFTLLLALPALNAQADKWEELGERLSEKADRIAEQAERSATRWEAMAGKIGQRFERQFDKDWSVSWRGLPREIKLASQGRIFLGIEVSGLAAGKARKLGFKNIHGSYVTRVIENSAAARAGLQPFDYIYGVEEQRTSDNQDLVDILEDYEPGDEVTLYFVRNGMEQTARVVLQSTEDADWEEDFGLDGDRAFLGVREAGGNDDTGFSGVAVEVVDHSTAQELGLQDGDIITAIDGHAILDWDDITTAIQNAKAGEDIEVTWSRDGQTHTAKGTMKAYNEVYPDEEESWGIGSEDVPFGQLEEDVEIEIDEDKAFLGVYVESISKEKARKMGFDNPYGSFVSGVVKNSGAAKSGLQAFDYIIGIDEYRVGENQSLGGILKRYQSGDEATVHFVRKGKKTKATLTFGSYVSEEKKERNSCEDPFFGIIRLHNDDEEITGVKIDPVEGSTAAELGLQKGDIIQTINGFTMVDWDDITLAIEMLNPGESIAVEYLRDGVKKSASKAIKSYAETKNCDDCDCGKKKIVMRLNDAAISNFDFKWRDEKERSIGRAGLEGATISVEDLSSEELAALQQKGTIDDASNSLDIQKLRIAPDAAAGLFQVAFTLASSGDTQVRVHNSAGRTIYEYDLGEFSGEFDDKVDISQNGAGNYYLQIKQGNKSFTKKIVLAKD